MAIESLILMKLLFRAMPDEPKAGHIGCGMEELGNHIIHNFVANIDAMGEQKQLHSGKITLEILHAQLFHSLMAVQ